MGYFTYFINGIYWDYNPLTKLLLTSWDLQVLFKLGWLFEKRGTETVFVCLFVGLFVCLFVTFPMYKKQNDVFIIYHNFIHTID